MKKIILPIEKKWAMYCRRPEMQQADLSSLVKEIFAAVNKEGDKAVIKYNAKFDRVKNPVLKISEAEISDARKSVSPALQKAIRLAARNIETFHKAQLTKSKKINTSKGVTCWVEPRAIETAGIYIPGGTAPLFSTVLMLAIPARIAGCKNIILCSPPGKNGKIHPAVLYTASLAGVKNIYAVGGIQAIAAMSLGTSTIPKADKIFGPGNQYVTAAKQYAQQTGTAIDMPAGPSELLVIADKRANAAFVAADLLSQAEHGTDSQVILLSDSRALINKVIRELKKQTAVLPRKNIILGSLRNSKAILLKDMEACIRFSNQYAPEHLIIATENPVRFVNKLTNAGSVFLGDYSPESAGDYASGTNHTLPTNGYARSYSGVSVDSFLKKISFQQMTRQGLQTIGPAIEEMASAEELMAHKNAVTIRLKK
ncbi:MAG: histidinol dehydrogenase [Chitinophagaceae bacterium]|nr:histidinol dehydrogenase [Chitinophagaceae bacterium]